MIKFAVELPDKRTLDIEAENIAAARAGSRQWWNDQIKTSQARIKDALWRPVGAFLVGAILLGLTRVTRWIVMGK